MRSAHVLVACSLLGAAHVAMAQAPGAGTVAGVALDARGHAIAGVAIEIPQGTARAHTDSTGAFRVAGVPAGVVTLRARRLGYAPIATAVDVRASEEVRVELRFVATVQHLDAVEVRDRRDPSEARLAGFRDRQARKASGGHFITRAQLDQRSNTRLIDVIRELPGVRIRAATRLADRSVRFRGASCPPFVFIDGFPAVAGEFELDNIDLSTVEGIEIYPGLASVPAQFQGVRGQHRCGVIAVWSRPPRVRRVARRAERPARVATLVDEGRVYLAGDVDQGAALDREQSPEAVYPDTLWKGRVAGNVVIEVIVDTLGRPEPESISIVSASAPLFGAAAREAVRQSVFSPAWKGGRRVRQVVHVPFVFRPLAPP